MKTILIYFRTLSRNKVFSLISIGGFSLSLVEVKSCCGGHSDCQLAKLAGGPEKSG